MLSFSEENYLKAIYHIEKLQSNGVSTNAVAEKMDTKASSVTDMLQKLAEKRLVIYKKYKGALLSAKGKEIAISVIRKHRLWESFLVNKLNFSWDEVHDIAEQLEHIQSDELINRLDAYLGFPKVDPHGDPIPDKDGNIAKQEKIKLSNLKETQQGILVTIKDSSDDFLRYLDKKSISIGSTIKVIAIEPFDKSILVKIGKKELMITENVANNLLVKEI
ncbi:MAG TPA: iron-dependent repressor [Flavobacteriaceae bacterium]|jgi:DtxR family Mn-dependent transcriptional regulator|nr:iron-dependent repressor [Flavobacteriaceae bacterium]HBS12699.1 iron-dependent repressor [Flavobacteriaceae bacterium]